MERVSRSKNSPSFSTYLREVNATPILGANDEKDLAVKTRNGDPEARDLLIRANLRLVVNIARGYAGKGLGLDDLCAEGNLGLMRAVEGFDTSMNVRFATYAAYWIKQSICLALIINPKIIRVPVYMVGLLSEWRRVCAKLQDEFGRPPSHEEIAATLNLPKKKLGIIKKAIRAGNAATQTEQTEGVVDIRQKSPGVKMVEAEDLHRVLGLLEGMDYREATVLRLRFGINEDESRSLNQIGKVLRLTRERVRQIEGDALAKLAESMSKATV